MKVQAPEVFSSLADSGLVIFKVRISQLRVFTRILTAVSA